MGKCLISISYFAFYTIPSSLLGLSALFFNSIIALTLSSQMYTASFIAKAWGIVRDLSNLFFILILLYIAVELILGIGHDTKKMIIRIILMALLINFSMFMTNVIIDSSNILALVFYNKINVDTTTTEGGQVTPRAYSPIWSPVRHLVAEKDISGGIFSSFDPTKLMTQDFFDKAKTKTQRASWLGAAAYIGGGAAVGGPVGALVGAGVYGAKTIFISSSEVPDSLILTIIIVAGLIMAFAAHTFFIAGISFVGRLIELWISVIFSPFAFMSSSLPLLSKIESIGWDGWLKRLLQVSFMAPIFMFFIYLIFLLIQVPLLKDLAVGVGEQDTYQVMLLIILQALIILILLAKATDYAKKGAGKLGEIMIKGTEIAMGLAVGAGLGVGAKVLQGTVGQASSRLANSEWAKRREAEGRFGGAAIRKIAQRGASGSFDVRQGAVGGVLAAAGGISGLNLGHGSKLFKEAGGFEADKKKKIENRQKRAKDLEVGGDEGLKRELNELEEQKQGLLLDVSHDIEQLDNRIKVWRERAADTARAARLNANGDSGLRDATGAVLNNTQANILAEDNLGELRQHRNAIKNGVDYTPTAVSAIDPADVGVVQSYSTRTRVGGVATGASINDLEDTLIPHAYHALEVENRTRKRAYADVVETGTLPTLDFFNAGGRLFFGGGAQREAANKIRMETKIEDKGGGH